MRRAVAGLVLLLLLVWLGMLWRGPGAYGAPLDRGLEPGRLAGSEPLSIVLLGTSLSSERYDWPEALAAELSACLAREVALTRITRAGANAAWGAGQGARVAELAPDLVLVEFAINDADIRDGLWRGRARAETAGLIAALPGPVVLMTMNPARGLRGVLRPRLSAHYADYRRMEAPLIDLEPRWRALPRGGRGLAGDGLHPDPGIARNVIIAPVRDYIAAAAGQVCGA